MKPPRRPRPAAGDTGGIAVAEPAAVPALQLVLEAPAAGARITVNRRLTGFGWALAPGGVRAIHVALGERGLGHAETGLVRADLGPLLAEHPGARPGFRFDCQVPALPTGPAALLLTVETADGTLHHRCAVDLVDAAAEGPAADADAIAPLRLTLEEARLTPSFMLHVRGWCVGVRPLRSVEIRAGTRLLGRAEHGLPRGDVADALPAYPNAPLAGFALRCVLDPGEAHSELTAIATDGAGLRRTATCAIAADPAADLSAAPPLLMRLEGAALDAVGMLSVRGWAVSATPIEQVRVWLGDQLLGDAEMQVPRADVGLAWPHYPGAALGGFQLQRRLAATPASLDALRAEARAAGGVVVGATLSSDERDAPGPAPAPAETGPIRFFCDAATLTEDGLLRVKGWALCDQGITAVAVHLDGREIGAATPGEDRADVARAFPDIADARRSGFRFTGRVGADCTGTHTLRLIVTGGSGARHAAELELRAAGQSGTAAADIAAAAPGIRCYLDQPAVQDGRAAETVHGFLSLAGWAFSPAGLTGIEVFVDGRSHGEAHRGIRREDLHQALGVKEALHAGFAMLIPPQVMSRGSHAVRVVIRDAAGAVEEIGFTVESEPALAGDGPWSLRRKLTEAETDLQLRVLAACGYRPSFTLLLAGAGTRRGLDATVASLRDQALADWTLVVPGTTLPAALAPIADRVRLLADDPALPLAGLLAADAPGLLGVLGPGDTLGEDALLELAVESALDRGADFLYADERRIDPADGEQRAFFKPDFAPDLLLATNYIGRPWVAGAALLARSGATLGELARHGEYDLVLRLTEQAGGIRHVPKVLAARAARALDPPATERRALLRALARRDIAGTVHPGCIAGTWRVQRRPAAGLVSIIIPTIAARGLIRTAIASIRAHTAAGRAEIVVLDNIPTDAPDAAGWKDWLRAEADAVVEIAGGFNWSRFNNHAARHARGEFLLFLNDDIEVLDAGWLDALLEHAGRAEIGAVGGLLLYPDGRVQHAGQFLAGTVGRHAFRFSPADQPGPFGLALTARNVIAVTGACLMTRRDVFDRLGGFDEQHDIINNDLDYCLRLRQAGLGVVYTPQARLTHHEMASRAELADSFDQARFGTAWADLFATGDPYFSPHLAPDTDDYVPQQEPLRALTIGHPLIGAARVRRILALKLDHIGDFIAAFPAFRRLKQAFPNAELTVLAAGASLALAGLEPAIDRVIRFDFFHAVSEQGRRTLGRRELAELAATLAPWRFDLALDLRRQPDTRAVLQHTGARWLAGFDRNNQTRWLDIAVEWEGDQARTHKRAHISETLVAFVDAVAGACAPERALIAAAVPDDARAAAVALPALAGCDFTRPLVAIHAGAGAENKQWPVENFAALIDLLAERAGAAAVIIGGADEAPMAAAVLAALRRPERVVSVAGALGLRELPVLLRACALYIGNDSGPKHLAAALGVPTLGIHSGTVDTTEWGPLGPAAVAVRREMTCSPCYLAHARDCHRGLACLRGIRVADVWPLARRLLALRAPP